MNRITLTLATVLSLAFTQVTAQDLNKGLEAAQASDYATALKELKPLAEQGNASAQNGLGLMYSLGASFLRKGVLQDNLTAHMWYNISSANGHEKAGEYRDKLEALMIASDVLKAMAMARECMNSNYKECGYLPAFTQVTSQDFSERSEAYKAGDYVTALKELKPLAEQGDADAQSNLGFIYRYGKKGVLKNTTEAIKWYRLSAEQGDADAQSNLGDMYNQGEGVLKDYAKAVKWYRLSAEQGHSYAQYSLGNMYNYGNGVLKDYIETLKWYRLSAEQGNSLAQNGLGLMYEEGNGVLQDNLTAHMWYNISSANGGISGRDWVADLMTATDISKATAMARECMKSNYKKCGY
tara:strand:- start:21 stop:1076 length:1056 start_codon:yes stop_codon:yes gene_type:complete